MRLQGKAALITGAGSQGIGREIALAFAREGARVMITGRTPAKLEETAAAAKTAGEKVEIVTADISKPAEARNAVKQTVDRLGRIDILVNNAAVLLRKPFLETTPEEWDWIFATNVRGSFLCAQAAAREMIQQGKGKIIMISSDTARVGLPLLSAYAATKGAILSLTRTLAVELAPRRINVNAILPGMVKTDMNRNLFGDPGREAAMLERFPLGRIGTPADIAGAALYLASDESEWVTGQYLSVDGGHTAK